MSISIGDAAPDFTLSDSDGNDVTLSSFQGNSAVTLVFIPFAFSGICGPELCEIQENLATFNDANSQVLAITCNAKHALGVWKEQEGLEFPLLSDFWPHGAVAQQYGCFDENIGCALRRTVTIGVDGTIVDIAESGGIGEARTLEAQTGGLAKL